MKFLVDAHLPKKLSDFLVWKGFDSVHTLELQNKNATTDSEINLITLEEKRVLITKDADFIESLLISNKPYKLLYIAIGNVTNKVLLEIFKNNLELIVKELEKARFIELNISQLIIKQ